MFAWVRRLFQPRSSVATTIKMEQSTTATPEESCKSSSLDGETRAALCFRKLCVDIFGPVATQVKWATDNKTVGYFKEFHSNVRDPATVVATLRATLKAIDTWEADGSALNIEEQVIVLTHFWKQASKWGAARNEMTEAYHSVNDCLVRCFLLRSELSSFISYTLPL